MFQLFFNIKKISDEELFGRYLQTGDRHMAEELYRRYFHIVLGVAYKYLQDREEAKDVVMEVFEKFMVESKVQVVQNFGGWIYATTKNASLNRIKLRERNTKRKEDYSLLFELDSKEDDSNEDLIKLIPEALDSLVEQQRRCICLFYFERKTYKEIMELTGYTDMEVKSYIQNGKRNLKIILENRTKRAI